MTMISQNSKQDIYKIMKTDLFPHIRYNIDIMNIISSVWDVYSRPSTGEDSRYQKLGDEIDKHYIMNDDWSDDKLFLSILNLYSNDEIFFNFVQQILEFILKNPSDDYSIIRSKIEEILKKEKLQIRENDNHGIIISIMKDGNIPTFIEDKKLPFRVCKSIVTFLYDFSEEDIQWPQNVPCFVLTNNYEWNDFSYNTWYHLYFMNENSEKTLIGDVKIMKKGELDTSKVIPCLFYSLDNDFCSLGRDKDYYDNFRTVFGKKAYIYLSELRDSAFYSSIYNEFKGESGYAASLLRLNSSEEALRLGRYIIYGRDIDNAFSFTYKFCPGYDKNKEYPQEINFDFKYKCKPYQRIYGIIGENGVGKSTLINQILGSLIKEKENNFTSLRPLYSNTIVVSYSPFDTYQLLNENGYFIDYEYCGLMKSEREILSLDDQVENLDKNLTKILERKSSDRLFNKWRKIIKDVIPLDVIDKIFEEVPNEDLLKIKKDELKTLCQQMSSGETMFLYSISSIIANIRKETLIFFDEPEQHLHPKAVTLLMRSIFNLLESFDSYAIISTHSPYVVRELHSSNVFVFKRTNNILDVSKIGIESFGEDVSVLSDVIFDNMSEQKRYEHFIQETAESNDYDYDKTVEALTIGENTLGLNARLLIRTLINKKANETS